MELRAEWEGQHGVKGKMRTAWSEGQNGKDSMELSQNS